MDGIDDVDNRGASVPRSVLTAAKAEIAVVVPDDHCAPALERGDVAIAIESTWQEVCDGSGCGVFVIEWTEEFRHIAGEVWGVYASRQHPDTHVKAILLQPWGDRPPFDVDAGAILACFRVIERRVYDSADLSRKLPASGRHFAVRVTHNREQRPQSSRVASREVSQ